MKALEWTFLLEKREKKKNSYVIKLSVKSPSLSPPIPSSFSGIRKVRKSAPVEALRKKGKRG
jgi:hypothetical protein